MATMDAERIFIDTNILASAVIPESPRYFHAQGLLRRLARSDSELWISRQVIREFVCTLSRQELFRQKFSQRDLTDAGRNLLQRNLVAEDQEIITEQLFVLLENIPCGGKQIHDANIVATMLAFDIRQLVTYNLSDFQRFASFVAVSSEV
jgi:predicted nucleic acid-binding protein